MQEYIIIWENIDTLLSFFFQYGVEEGTENANQETADTSQAQSNMTW